ncbi:MAG: UDP-N-acetylmuramoyl-L-alanine--D-glutamate ligase [Candidatus Paceibacterota bacterium]
MFNSYFKDKKITVMGLGLLGRGVGITKYLAECGTKLIVTDLKSEQELKPSLDKLKDYKDIEYVLGEHKLSDFEDRDMIIRAPNVPKKSKYILHANKKGIPVEMDASLFVKLIRGTIGDLNPLDVKIVGVTGTRGKTTTSYLLDHILSFSGISSHLAGNIRDVATLPLLDDIKDGDCVVLELDSWQLQGFGESKISPDIAIFSNFFPDHQNYYKSMDSYFDDKANIFKYQTKNNHLILSSNSEIAIKKYYKEDLISKVSVVDDVELGGLELWAPGDHIKKNVALAKKVAEIMGVNEKKILEAIKVFKGVEGRMQYIKTIKGVKIFNDNNATSPEATISAINSFSSKGVILIAGGADKNLDYRELGGVINKKVGKLILLPGTAIDKLKEYLHISFIEVGSLKEAVEVALNETQEESIVLFSPAAASFGLFNNEYERSDEFLRIVNNLK